VKSASCEHHCHGSKYSAVQVILSHALFGGYFSIMKAVLCYKHWHFIVL